MHELKNKKGGTLIELIMVMILLILFGVTIFTLIYAGADTQQRIMREKNSQIDARIALSYINVRLRQNDTAGKITIEKNEMTGEDSILIKERGEDGSYDTWIYWANGKLMECLVDPGEQPLEMSSFLIVNIDGFETGMDYDNEAVTSKVIYTYGDGLKDIASTIYLRSN